MAPNADEAKTNRLTIYMIKPEIKSLAQILKNVPTPIHIGGVGDFYFQQSHSSRAAWLDKFFVGTLSNLTGVYTASARGVLVAPAGDGDDQTIFVLAFGIGHFMINDDAIEQRFGLKVVLNSAEPESFRSIEKTNLGAVPKHTREQMARGVTPADFGIDIDQDLIGGVTAQSRDQRLGNYVTGKDGLYVTTKVDVNNVSDLLSHCVSRYRSTDYKKDFDWIDQISEAGRATSNALNDELVERVSRRSLDKIWMAVPEVVDWSLIGGFRYKDENRDPVVDDLDMSAFAALFQGKRFDIDSLKSTKIFVMSTQTADPIMRWSAYRCTYAEIECDGSVYVLNGGTWYEIAKGFTEEIQRYYLDTPDSSVQLADYVSGDEFFYNTQATAALGNACLMDQKSVPHGGGHSKIEFCDIFTKDGKLIHVKKYAGSTALSHLFAQGVTSGELFASDEDFRQKLNVKLPPGFKLPDPLAPPVPSNYEIVYAIISKATESLDIPFFSKVSLRNARRRLKSVGFNVTKKKIQKI